MLNNVVKAGRIDIETLYLTEKGGLLFLSVNLIAASLGINRLAWSENDQTEFVFGWNSWMQTDVSNTGVVVIREISYDSSDCVSDSCDASMHAGTIFFALNMMALILLAFCCLINLEMAVFHRSMSLKKIANAIMAVVAFSFNLTSWSYWSAQSKTTDISQENAGNTSMYASSFWYSVFACFFLFVYCILVLKQNIVNCLDKHKVRQDARPLPAARIPTQHLGNHQDRDISRLLNSRVITSEVDPPAPTIPDLPRKLTTDSDNDVEDIRRPVASLALKNVPPPLPPRRISKEPLPPTTVVRVTASPTNHRKEPKTSILRKRSRSRGLPSVRNTVVVTEVSSRVTEVSSSSVKEESDNSVAPVRA